MGHKLVVHSVVSPGYERYPRVKAVTALFEHHGYDYRPHVDPIWYGWESKLHHHMNMIEKNPGDATHIMFIDGADVVPLAGPDVVFERWLALGHPWVSIAEPFIWSPGSFTPEQYPTPQCTYRYLNGGACIGEAGHMYEWMERWTAWVKPMSITTDQDWLAARMIESYPKALVLDHNCDLFQCMCGSDPVLDISPGVVYNRVTGTQPLIIHYNGGTDITWANDPKADGMNRRILWEHWLT